MYELSNGEPNIDLRWLLKGFLWSNHKNFEVEYLENGTR